MLPTDLLANAMNIHNAGVCETCIAGLFQGDFTPFVQSTTLSKWEYARPKIIWNQPYSTFVEAISLLTQLLSTSICGVGPNSIEKGMY